MLRLVCVFLVGLCCSLPLLAQTYNSFPLLHPGLQNLQVRVLHQDYLNRIWIGTDSGLYRLTSHNLALLDNQFKISSNAFNGPISKVEALNNRYLAIHGFPNTLKFYDMEQDGYIATPFPELENIEGNYRDLQSFKINKHTWLWTQKNKLFLHDELKSSTNLLATLEYEVITKPIIIKDLIYFKNNSGIFNFNIKTKETKLLISFLPEQVHHFKLHLDASNRHLYLVTPDSVHLINNRSLSEVLKFNSCNKQQLTRLASLGVAKNANFINIIPLTDTLVALVNECGIHKLDLSQNTLTTIDAPSETLQNSWVNNAWYHAQLPAFVDTLSGAFLLDKNGQIVKISNRSHASTGGSTVAAVNAGKNTYIYADGTPGLKILNKVQSHFKGLSKSQLELLTRGHAFRQLLKESDTKIWLASQGNGLFLIEKTNQEWQTKFNFFNNQHIRALHKEKDKLWVATETIGLWLIDLGDFSKKQIIKNNRHHRMPIFRIEQGNKHNELLIGTGLGLIKIDKFTHKIIAEFTQQALTKFNAPKAVQIWGAAQAQNGDIWLATHNPKFSLIRLDNALNLQQVFLYKQSLPEYVIYDLKIKGNSLILATWGGGVTTFNISTEEYSSLTTEHGLPSDNVLSLNFVDDHTLWVSTDRGLAEISGCFDCQEETYGLRAFDIRDNLNTVLFDVNSDHLNTDGSLIYGGFFGINWFHPKKDIKFNTQEITTAYIEQIKANGQKTINVSDSLQLESNINYLDILFASGDYIQPTKQVFNYKINDGDWKTSESGNLRLDALSPGQINLQYQAVNNDGIMTNAIKNLDIVILPPWWKSSLAINIYVLMILILIVFIAIHRINIIKRKNSELTKLVNDKTLALQQALHSKDILFENTSHELKTPLSIIKGHINVLERLKLGNDAQQSIHIIEDKSNHLLSLVNDLLSLSEPKEAEVHDPELYILAACLELKSEFSPILEMKQITLETNINVARNAYLKINQKSFKIIFNNLIKNAIEHSPSDTSITLQVVLDGSYVRIDLVDQGSGLQELDTLLTRYSRGSEHYAGSGLGLNIVKHTLEICKGNIKQIPVDLGTHLQVSLPVYFKQLDKISPPPINANRPTLMIVEDNLELIFLFEKFLSDKHNLLVANNGQQALDLLSDTKYCPDIIISDIMMPIMDGYELCRILKSSQKTSYIPILMVTAKGDVKSQIKGFELGAEHYISKPFDSDGLQLIIRNTLTSIKLRKQFLLSQLKSDDIKTDNHQQHRPPEAPFIAELRSLILENCQSQELTLEQVCCHFHMSASTLNRKLKALTGLTFKKLELEVRLYKAQSLLKQGKQVKVVAMECGFSNTAHLSKAYKDKFEVSPKQSQKHDESLEP